MRAQVSTWGNSLAVRIPKAYANEMRIEEGSEVDIQISNGLIILSPLSRNYTLESLLAGITPENIHEETDTGKPLGKEIV